MIKEKAYAKINLFLNVVSKRFDGYHDLEMVMATIDLFDVVSLKANDTGEIIITTSVEITSSIEDNIVYKIASFMKEEFNVNKGASIHIEKNIPIAGGLAGGSADAAATLRGLNKLWKLKLSLDELAKIGLEFGSDIPFCIYNRLCVARGRGEELLFLKNKLNIPIILVNPNVSISTKEVFSRVKKENLVERKINDMTSAIYNNNLELMTRELHNSLEHITFEIEPKVKKIKEQLLELGVDGALMSGSGATVFGISSKKAKLKYIYEIIDDKNFKLITKIR